MSYINKRNITPEKAISFLKKEGLIIDLSETEIIVDFLYLLAEVFVGQIAEDENS